MALNKEQLEADLLEISKVSPMNGDKVNPNFAKEIAEAQATAIENYIKSADVKVDGKGTGQVDKEGCVITSVEATGGLS